MNKEYKEKILKTGLEGFLIGIAIGVAAGIVYFFTHQLAIQFLLRNRIFCRSNDEFKLET